MDTLIPSALSREKVDFVKMVTKLKKETNVARFLAIIASISAAYSGVFMILLAFTYNDSLTLIA